MTSPQIPLPEPKPPYAEVRRSGRWTWWITLKDGLSDGGGWHCWGDRERADKKAARLLARYRRNQDRWNDVHRVGPDEADQLVAEREAAPVSEDRGRV